MRNIFQHRRALIAVTTVMVIAGLIAIGCSGDSGGGIGSKLGSGLNSIGQTTGSFMSKAGTGLSNIGSGGNNAATGGEGQLGALLSAGEKLAEAGELNNLQRQKELGQSVAVAISNKFALSTDARASDYVNLVGMTIASVSAKPEIEYTFGILETPDVNAYSTVGGYIFITRGALQMAADESELAGVLAHEVAHVALNHPVDSLKTAKVVSAGVGLAESRNAQLREFEQLTDGAVEQALNGLHSRAQESAADAEAVRYLVAAGYDPNGLTRFLEKLQAKTGAGGGVDQLMKNHPGTAERVAAVKLQAANSHATGLTLKERFVTWMK